MNIHNGVNPFECEYPNCEAKFSDSSNLITHKRRYHTGEKPFNCTFEGCEKNFITSTELKIHERTHNGSRPFVCDFPECDAKFSTSGSLDTHIKRHNDVKPFKCECGARFVTKKDLGVHSRVHSGIKPYKCTFEGCKSSFTTSGILKVHYRTHTGEKPYRCQEPNCGATFAQSPALKSHIKCWHTEQGQILKRKHEARIMRLLEQNKFEFKTQHTIDFVCIGDDREGSRCFIDFLVECKDDQRKTKGIVFLEVDEEQHAHYEISCELRRMMDVQRTLVMDGNTLPIAFVRYNTHAFKVDGKTKRTYCKDKEKRLVEFLNNLTFKDDFQVAYLYYDIIDGVPSIFHDVSYDKTFKTLVKHVIY